MQRLWEPERVVQVRVGQPELPGRALPPGFAPQSYARGPYLLYPQTLASPPSLTRVLHRVYNYL